MAQTNVNIRMDEDLKKQFDTFCSDVGMTMTTAFCIFAKTAVREQRIPFEISSLDENGFTPSEVAELRRRIADLEAGRNIPHNLLEVDE